MNRTICAITGDPAAACRRQVLAQAVGPTEADGGMGQTVACRKVAGPTVGVPRGADLTAVCLTVGDRTGGGSRAVAQTAVALMADVRTRACPTAPNPTATD